MFNRGRSKTLSAVDAAWLQMEDPTNLMMITGMIVFDEPVDFERLQRTLDYRFVRRFRRFRQRVVRRPLGLPQWQDDPNFDLAAHLHRIALPSPGDQQALQDLVSDLMSMPLDFSKPLWQFHLVENPEGRNALLIRLHHSIGDGIALIRVMLSLTDTDPDAPWPEADAETRRQGWNPLAPITRPTMAALRTAQQMTGTTVRTSISVARDPEQLVDLARWGSETALATGRLLLRAPDPKTLYKGKLGVRKRAAWSQPVPLEEVKMLGRAMGGTINDVLLTAAAGALRRYMLSRGESADGIDFRAVIPVNLRPLDGELQLGNRFGLVFLSLPVGIADPVERLRELKRRMDDLKDSPEPLVAYGILNFVGVAPTQIEEMIVNIFGSKATAVMTNVPGPQQKLYFAGSGVNHMMFWVPQSGRLGLGLSILSYNREVMVGVATDVGLVPDPEAIVDAFHEELADLKVHVRQVVTEVATQFDVVLGALDDVEAGETHPADGLTGIKGMGPAYAEKLRAGGIVDLATLAASAPEQLESIVGVAASQQLDYQDWIDQARQLVDAG